jgi:hypothetical protein
LRERARRARLDAGQRQGAVEQVAHSERAGAVAKTAATATVPQVEAGKVAAVVVSEPEPRYSKVAPGIAVHVRPTVLADGSAARLKIDARFGVAISDYNPSQQKADDQWVQAPPPGISAHPAARHGAGQFLRRKRGLGNRRWRQRTEQGESVDPHHGWGRDRLPSRHATWSLGIVEHRRRMSGELSWRDEGWPSRQGLPGRPPGCPHRSHN